MTDSGIAARDRAMILAHYYRAMVGRADIWRTRMDTTTNWSIGATAAVISFSLGDPAVPHYVVGIAALMTVTFLMLEARRLTFYHLWQKRVLLLEKLLIRPAFAAGREGTRVAPVGASRETPAELEALLDAGLGRTVPSMSRVKAAARRLRRVYLYLFAVQLFAWGFKLANHPGPAGSVDGFLARAQVAGIPGAVVLGTTALIALAGTLLALLAGGVDRDPA